MGTITLKKHIDSLDFPKQLDAVKNLLDNAQSTITFWGNRVVTVKGYGESIYLDDIARKVMRAAADRADEDNLTPKERIFGLEIVRKLNDFYKSTDTILENANIFTRFFNWIVEFTFNPYTPRFYIEDVTELRFRAFSKEKFLAQFGGEISSGFPHPCADAIFGSPSRICAKEEHILALLHNS